MTDLYNLVTRKVGTAIGDFKLVSDGDNILVGLSGGKDSYTLLDVLLILREKAPIDFSITGITIDSGFEGFQGNKIADYCESRAIPFIYKKTEIMDIITRHKNPKKSFCSFCARLRRGSLYSYAHEHGFNKIALGHHADDLVETILMNMFYSGSMKSMAPYHVSDDKKNIVIRPLVYVFEKDIRTYAREKRFPIICCSCPICKSVDSKRKRIKQLLLELEKETPNIKANLLNSLSNVVPSHLLAQL